MIILFSGPNDYAITQELKNLKTSFAEANGEDSINHFQADNLEETNLANLIMGGSLFSQARLLIIENLTNNKDIARRLDQYLGQVPEDVTLVITDNKPDKRTSWYKLINKIGKIQEFFELSDYQAVTWVEQYVKNKKGRINHKLANFLVERVGTNQWSLSNEIDKLLTFDSNVTEETIEQLVEINPRDTIFQLLDAVVKADTKRAHRLYNQLQIKEIDAHQFIGMMAWQLHNMLIVRTNFELNDREVASRAGLSPFVVEKNRKLVTKLTLRNIKNMIDLSIKTDFKLKQTGSDKNQRIKLLIDQIGQIFINSTT